MPGVSVVIPTFNRRGLLMETLDAVRAQTHRELDIIVVDNMSEDGTEPAVKELVDSRIRYVRNANDGIIARNRNLGIRLAHGKYVAFCDDDDIWSPDKIARQVAAMEADPGVALCYTDASVFRRGKVLPGSLVRWKVARGHFRRLVFRNFIASSSVMARKNVLDAMGGFDESGALVPYEDYELWLRIAHGHRLAYVDERLLKYRVHGTNWAGRYGNRQRIVVNVLKSVRTKLGVSSPLFSVAIGLRNVKAAMERR